MFYEYFPVPSCRMGALWALADVKGACILEFGPAGTTHFSLEGMSNLNAEPQAHAVTTHISERDLTFGETKRLEEAIVEVDQTQKPSFIFVMSSTLTSIIGVDIFSVCEMMQDQVKAKLIPLKSDGFQGDFSYGIKEVLDLLVKHVVEPQSQKKGLTYNLLGSHMDEWSSRSDVRALKRLMRDIYGAEAHVVFTNGSSVEKIAHAAEAEINICMRQEARSACEYLQNTHNQPFVTDLPFGMEGMKKFCESIEALTGWVKEKDKFDDILSEGKQMKRQMQTLFKREPQKILIGAHATTARGIENILREWGVEEIKCLINHKVLKADETLCWIDASKEEVKRKLLQSFDPDLILGDGVLLDMASKKNPDFKVKGFQISNPNLSKHLLHHEVPHMGVEGMRYLMQNILNLL